MTSYDKGPSNISRYGNEAWTFLKVDQTFLESFEMWCWRRMHKKKKGFLFAQQPQWTRSSSFTRFLNNTQRRTKVGRTSVDG
jgi:hypothetical protein